MPIWEAVKIICQPWRWFREQPVEEDSSGPFYWEDPEVDPVSLFPWSGEFDLTSNRDRQTIQLIDQLQQKGVQFKAYRTTGKFPWGASYGMSRSSGSDPGIDVGQFRNFPTSDDLWRHVAGDWGGGTYIVQATNKVGGILPQYHFSAPAKQSMGVLLPPPYQADVA